MTLPGHVGVIGGGRMGAGIAHAFLVAGTSATVVESSAEAAQAARDRVATSIARAGERDSLHGATVEEVCARLQVATSLDVLAGDTELVVEAVPEDSAMKVAVLGAAAAHLPEAVLATNTSSLSVGTIASGLPRPSALVGLHFFNPVPSSELVEIVVGADTPAAVVSRAQEWVRDLDKTAITVTDSPGFASSRLGVAIALEAMRMLDEGVASAEDIDTAMTLGYKHPVGPLRTTDIVGLDVRLAIAEHLERELGPRFAPPDVLRDKVASGDLGRKTGQGFYAW